MKRFLLVFGLMVFFSGLANALITRVQSKAANTGNATSTTLTITLDSAATIGNTLIVAASGGANTRAKFGSINTEMFTAIRTSTLGLQIMYLPVNEASSTIALTFGNNVGQAAVAVEYTGRLIVPDIAPLSNTATSTTNTTGTTASTHFANELVVAAMGTTFATSSVQTGWLTGITNSFSSVAQTSSNINSSSDREVAFLENIVTSTGTYSTAGTQTSALWVNEIATFTDNPTPTPTATATATNTPTPTATATASATATATSTPTPTPPIETSHTFGG